MILNHKNIEELVFRNQEVHKLLPEFQGLFSQWKMGVLIPALKPSGNKAIYDFLNLLTNEHISILEKHFGTKISIEKVDYAIIKNYTMKISEAQDTINKLDLQNIFLYRDDTQLYIGSWR